MIKSRIIPALFIIVVLCAQGVTAGDQVVPYSTVSAFFMYNGWEDEWANELTSGQDKWSEAVVGTQVRHIVNPRLAVELRGTLTAARYTSPLDDKISFSSLNDTRLKGTYYFGDRVARAVLALNLPTGKKELSVDEYLVALGVSDNSRKFPVRRFGEGFNVGAEVYWLPKTEQVNLEVGGGYRIKGAYRILEGDPADYKYGNEFFVQVSASTDPKPIGVSGAVMFKTYAKDEYADQPIFQSGNTVMFQGRLTYNNDIRGSVGFNVLLRGKGKTLGGDAGGLVDEVLKSGRNDLLIFGGGSYPLNEQLRLLGRAEYKHITANEFGTEAVRYRPKTSYAGLGVGAGYQFSLAVSGSVVGSYYTGSIDDDIDLTGLGLVMAVTFRYW